MSENLSRKIHSCSYAQMRPLRDHEKGKLRLTNASSLRGWFLIILFAGFVVFGLGVTTFIIGEPEVIGVGVVLVLLPLVVIGVFSLYGPTITEVDHRKQRLLWVNYMCMGWRVKEYRLWLLSEVASVYPRPHTSSHKVSEEGELKPQDTYYTVAIEHFSGEVVDTLWTPWDRTEFERRPWVQLPSFQCKKREGSIQMANQGGADLMAFMKLGPDPPTAMRWHTLPEAVQDEEKKAAMDPESFHEKHGIELADTGKEKESPEVVSAVVGSEKALVSGELVMRMDKPNVGDHDGGEEEQQVMMQKNEGSETLPESAAIMVYHPGGTDTDKEVLNMNKSDFLEGPEEPSVQEDRV